MKNFSRLLVILVVSASLMASLCIGGTQNVTTPSPTVTYKSTSPLNTHSSAGNLHRSSSSTAVSTSSSSTTTSSTVATSTSSTTISTSTPTTSTATPGERTTQNSTSTNESQNGSTSNTSQSNGSLSKEKNSTSLHFYIYGSHLCCKCRRALAYLQERYGNNSVTFYELQNGSNNTILVEGLFKNYPHIQTVPVIGIAYNGTIVAVIVGFIQPLPIEELVGIGLKYHTVAVTTPDGGIYYIGNREKREALNEIFIYNRLP